MLVSSEITGEDPKLGALYETPVPTEVTETSARILAIIFEYALDKVPDTFERLDAGMPKFLEVVGRFVAAQTEVKMCLPAFPFKSANKMRKVDDHFRWSRIQWLVPQLQAAVVPPFDLPPDLVSTSDRETWAYGQALRAMAVAKDFRKIEFSRLRDLVNFPLPEKLEEITYVANATNFRRFLLNKYGNDDLDIEHEIATNADTNLTYRGYRRFLESDLKQIFPLGAGRSGSGYKRDIKYLAQAMLVRGNAFATAAKHAFPDHLRLSIHHSTGEHKVSLSLLNTKTGFTTPWHCSVAQMATGEWISAPKGDFEKDPRFEVVHEDGRPSYFQEKPVSPIMIVDDIRPEENGVLKVEQPLHSDDRTSASPQVLGQREVYIDHRAEGYQRAKSLPDSLQEPVDSFGTTNLEPRNSMLRIAIK
nr:hypothetical protein CFP56_79228 [Quercus suber]